MDVAAFDYQLPEELIAKAPLPERDASRLLVLPKAEGAPEHRSVRDLPALLRAGDLLVVNDAKVIPARLHGRKEGTGGKVELLLAEPLGGRDWLALGNASKPLRPGAIVLAHGARIEVVASHEGELTVRLPLEGDELWRYLDEAGEMPLPPYIDRPVAPSHLARVSIPGRRRALHQLPPAALDPPHAGRGLRRPRSHPRRLRRGGAPAIPVLQLRRCDVDPIEQARAVLLRHPPRRRGQAREARGSPRNRRDAAVHAGRNGGIGEGDRARRSRRHRRADRPREHVSPAAAARTGSGRGDGGPAPLHVMG